MRRDDAKLTESPTHNPDGAAMTQTILCLDEGLTAADDVLDKQLFGLARVLMDGQPRLSRRRLAAAFVRTGLRLCEQHERGQPYYDFLKQAQQTVTRDLEAVRQWAKTYLRTRGA